MKVKINGVELVAEPAQQPLLDEQKIAESKIKKVGEHLTAASIGLGILNAASTAFAASGSLGDRILPLVHMLQDVALPVGIIVSTWGLLEIMIGNPAGKSKIKMSVIGYVGIFLVPELFYAVRAAFR